MARKSKYSRSAIVADAIGITHFIIASVIVVLGETTTLFGKEWTNHSGVEFVYTVLDVPIAVLFAGPIASLSTTPLVTLLVAELVIIASSILYGLIAYLVTRAIAVVWGA